MITYVQYENKKSSKLLLSLCILLTFDLGTLQAMQNQHWFKNM